MTSVDTMTDIEIMVEEALAVTPTCEHPQHFTHPVYHAGDAQWMMVGTQPKPCGHPVTPMYVCNRWKRLAEAQGFTSECMVCGDTLPRDFTTTLRFYPLNEL